MALSIRPDFAKAMTNLGVAYLVKRELQQALKWNRAALAIEPHQVEANRNMALVLQESGLGDQAMRNTLAAQAARNRYISNMRRTLQGRYSYFGRGRRAMCPRLNFSFRRPSIRASIGRSSLPAMMRSTIYRIMILHLTQWVTLI